MKRPVMRALGLSRIKIEAAAQKILRDFCPEAAIELHPLEIERMFELYLPKRFGMRTAYEDLSPGIHGYTDPNKMRSSIASRLVEAKDPGTRRFGRSTTGHEIGHCILHAHQFRRRNDTQFVHNGANTETVLYRQEDLKAYENPEWQAWEFCKSLFLPRHLLTAAVEKNYSVKEISERVDLNPAFIETRLANLGLSDKCPAY